MEPTPDKDDPEKKPPSRDLADLDPEERRFWDLEEDGDSGSDAPESDEASEENEPGDEGEDSSQKEDGGDEEESGKEAKSSPEDPPKRRGPRFSRGEFIWIGVLGATLLAGVIYAVSLFFKEVPTRKAYGMVDFPVRGERVVIGSVETYWRKPDREADGTVRSEARLIPAAMIKLKSGSGGSALRVFFKNDEDRIVGDPVTVAISDGNFAKGGESSREVNATDGFEQEGEHAAYVTEEVRFWHLIVREGPSRDAPGEEFKEILRMRISSARK